MAALVEQARERFGRIDILISNASALAVAGDRASWDASLDVDVMGAVRLGTPKEIADAAVWLVSPRAGWVNGASLVVDGGQSKGIR